MRKVTILGVALLALSVHQAYVMETERRLARPVRQPVAPRD